MLLSNNYEKTRILSTNIDRFPISDMTLVLSKVFMVAPRIHSALTKSIHLLAQPNVFRITINRSTIPISDAILPIPTKTFST